jgi:6-pyruvoyltetrahydropterin/6-carboxytetrahydropterin synthase
MLTGRLSRRFTFSAAHYIKSESLTENENLQLFGKCTKIHGHNYTLIVHFIGPIDPKTGIIIDLDLAKREIKPLLAKLDHSLVNEFVGPSATIENMAKYIYDELRRKFMEVDLQIELWETENNWIIYPYDTQSSMTEN